MPSAHVLRVHMAQLYALHPEQLPAAPRAGFPHPVHMCCPSRQTVALSSPMHKSPNDFRSFSCP